MRNWNTENDEVYEGHYELRAYLWGIETAHSIGKTTKELTDCEPTYEELKLTSRTWVNAHVSNCEPTYEELKPVVLQ